jgi:hypothetical protein
MSAPTLVDNVMANVRAILRQVPPFADMPRYQLDLHLADLERDLRRDLECAIDFEVEGAIQEARVDWEDEQAERAAARAEDEEGYDGAA